MGRILRKGVLFTLLFAGLVAPAAADPILMFLIGIAREMVISHGTAPAGSRVPEQPLPDFSRVYPGTSVEPDVLRRLIDDSFLYLSEAQRREIFDSLHAALMNPKNAAVRGAMIEYFAEKALTIRAAQMQLAKMSWSDKQRMAREFKAELAALSAEDQEQVGKLLRSGLLPVPGDLNQLLLATFDAPR
jgi:hypothetical protein